MAMTASEFAERYGMSETAAAETLARYEADPSNPEFASVAGIMQTATGVTYTGTSPTSTIAPPPPPADIPLPDTQQGTIAPFGAQQDLFQNPFAVGSPEWMEEVYGPRAGYMTGLGLYGKQGRTPFQSYQERLYDPLSRLYDLSSQFAAGGVSDTTPGGFMGQWGQPFAQNPFAMYAQARGMMGNVMGMAPEQRASFGLQGPTPALQDLMGMGLRQELGLPGAQWLSGRLPQEQEAWVSQYPQQQGPNFLDYVTQKYNLGRFF